MKNIDLMESLNYVDPKFIEEANISETTIIEFKPKKRMHIKWLSPIAAMLAIVILFTGITFSRQGTILAGTSVISEAIYPQMTKYPSAKMGSDEYRQQYLHWRNDVEKQESYYGESGAISPFILKSINTILSDNGGRNIAYSPLNLYITLAMMAEMGSGETRNQILDVLGCDSIEYLRKEVHSIWNANYRDDGVVKSIVASSIWLGNDTDYNKTTTNILSSQYYATVFEGKVGSQNYNDKYYEWLDKHTGGMFSDRIDETPLDDNSIISIATALNYEASWTFGFVDSRSSEGIFHSYYGDISCTYMNKIELYGGYYWGENFTATSKPLKDSGRMYFILPNDGISVDELLVDSEALEFIVSNGNWEKQDNVIINLTVPKMSVSSNRDLKFGLYKMGIKDCFLKGDSNFANLTKDPVDSFGYYVDAINHSVKVSVDEDGVIGSAYTEVTSVEGNPPSTSNIDFTVNKPFIFVITGADGTVLFLGLVNQPVD